MKALLITSVFKLRQALSLDGVVFTFAIASMGYGIGLISVPAAFIIVGSLFVILTTWGLFK